MDRRRRRGIGPASRLSRRSLLASAGIAALAGPLLARPRPLLARAAIRSQGRAIRPLPQGTVRLKPSIFANALEANRKYLLSLEPDRLLHNFRSSAGLAPKGAQYGGWESLGIAGHTLGHYLSACALMHAQTGDRETRERLRYIVAELAACQAAHGDGYIGGTTVERDGKTVDGKIVFEEIRRGTIRTSGFDINGGWVPLYTWHKVQAGLIAAEQLGGIEAARPVLVGMSDYLATILEGLDEDRMQALLAAEHGGLNESYAEAYALTGNPRYLRIAERIRHRAVLDPLSEGRDILAGLHANTQIPKLIGLARLHEITGDGRFGETARFFHRTVTDHHSYVIGGNSEREHFGAPDAVAGRLTDRTCEACNSYNMLRLTRHIYGWDGDPRHFDYYERTQLNHIMAHQHPETGMFVYFMPLGSGAKRLYSTPEDSFWCCVGSGMESHSKHGDSIYWEDGETLFVNLYIPSRLDWDEAGMQLDLETGYPLSDEISLVVTRAPSRPLPIALRVPGWCSDPALTVNGAAIPAATNGGYIRLAHDWRDGDRIALTLPMRLRIETAPDDPRLVAFLSGPLVLAADLGPADQRWDAPPPVLVAEDAGATLRPAGGADHAYEAVAARPEPLRIKPFFNLYERRTAVYFPQFTEAQWQMEEASFLARQREKAAIEARTVDVVYLGEMQPERDHQFAANHSDRIAYGGRSGRQVWWGEGNYLEFQLAVRPGPMVLRALYWGEDRDKNFDVIVDGERIANERRAGEPVGDFVAVDYPIPPALTRGKNRIAVRFETHGSDAPVYEVRTMEAPPTI